MKKMKIYYILFIVFLSIFSISQVDDMNIKQHVLVDDFRDGRVPIPFSVQENPSETLDYIYM